MEAANHFLNRFSQVQPGHGLDAFLSFLFSAAGRGTSRLHLHNRCKLTLRRLDRQSPCLVGIASAARFQEFPQRQKGTCYLTFVRDPVEPQRGEFGEDC